jgi:NAD(P)-dependent dehydrogenase (short-subunit alcohol dehydrogenase family)
MELENKVALVTGGTAGIGLEAARLFLREGAEVVITGRNEARGQGALDDLAAAAVRPGQVRFIQADLSDLNSVQNLAGAAGAVDILVNNAGAFPVSSTLEQSVENFEAVFDTNVKGAYFLVAALVPKMIAKGHGSIVNVTTMAAHFGVPDASVYSASKAALSSLTRTWAAEFGPKGLRVNSVAPGPTRTAGVLVEWGEGIEDLAKILPLGRTARAPEIAEAILFLASDRSSYMTGSTLHVDAGATAI